MNKILQAVARVLDQERIPWQERGKGRCLDANLQAGELPWRCCFVAGQEPMPHLLIVQLFPQRVCRARRHACAELLMHLNYRLLFGNFELDFGKGEVRHRMLLPVSDELLQVGRLEPLISSSYATFVCNRKHIEAVAFGGMTPQEAARRFDGESFQEAEAQELEINESDHPQRFELK